MSRLTSPGRWSRARRCAVVLALAAGLEAVALVVTPGAPPIYDGIGFPDEPYRFLAPPPGYRDTQPATTATRQLSLADGHSGGAATVSSAESGPQVSLYLPAGSIRATSAQAHEATVVAAPLTPDGRSVPGHPWGNVYRLSITADVGAATLAPGARAEIQLRAPSPQQPGPTFYIERNDHWVALTTHRTGNDFYQAEVAGPGDYVLASDHVLNVNAKNPNDEGNVSIVGLVLSVLGVAAAILIFVRTERRRSRRRTKVSDNVDPRVREVR